MAETRTYAQAGRDAIIVMICAWRSPDKRVATAARELGIGETTCVREAARGIESARGAKAEAKPDVPTAIVRNDWTAL